MKIKHLVELSSKDQIYRNLPVPCSVKMFGYKGLSGFSSGSSRAIVLHVDLQGGSSERRASRVLVTCPNVSCLPNTDSN